MAEQPLVSRIISQLANYEGGIIPMVEQHPGPGQDGQSAAVAAEKAAKKPKVRVKVFIAGKLYFIFCLVLIKRLY